MKLAWFRRLTCWVSRAPHGARGLKPSPAAGYLTACQSRPARGARIETHRAACQRIRLGVAPRTGRAD